MLWMKETVKIVSYYRETYERDQPHNTRWRQHLILDEVHLSMGGDCRSCLHRWLQHVWYLLCPMLTANCYDIRRKEEDALFSLLSHNGTGQLIVGSKYWTRKLKLGYRDFYIAQNTAELHRYFLNVHKLSNILWKSLQKKFLCGHVKWMSFSATLIQDRPMKEQNWNRERNFELWSVVRTNMSGVKQKLWNE